ncbi:hypothetical protein [Clostridium sp. Marseille-Q7071]
MNFGQVDYYDVNDVREWIGNLDVNIEKVLGIRTFLLCNKIMKLSMIQCGKKKCLKLK